MADPNQNVTFDLWGDKWNDEKLVPSNASLTFLVLTATSTVAPWMAA